MKECKEINCHIFNPRDAIFKSHKNNRAEYQLVSCNNSENCSLFKNNQCTFLNIFKGFCPHGKYKVEHGPTTRAKSFNSWIKDNSEKYKEVLNKIKSPPTKLAYVGDYVYFPYSHADMNESVKFLAHSKFFVSGSPFIKREDWTLETIKNIVDFRPYALFGGEITTYQEKEIPLFLQHFEEVDNGLYQNFLQKWPEYINKYKLTNKNYIGRNALLKTLNFPLTWETEGYKKDGQDNKYVVKWYWDGKVLKTKSRYAYNSTWGKFDNEEVQDLNIEIIPNERAILTIQNNLWVNQKTVFVD